jgi:hypothetical protein
MIVLVCGNDHDEEVEMYIKDANNGMSSFYACPRYYPEGRKNGERACVNRLNIVDCQNMVLHFSKLLEEAEKEGAVLNLTNMKYIDKKKNIVYQVLSHNNEEIKISVLNRRSLK